MALHADKLWRIRGRSLPVHTLSDQFEYVNAFHAVIHPPGLELAVLFPGLLVVPQFRKTGVELVSQYIYTVNSLVILALLQMYNVKSYNVYICV